MKELLITIGLVATLLIVVPTAFAGGHAAKMGGTKGSGIYGFKASGKVYGMRQGRNMSRAIGFQGARRAFINRRFDGNGLYGVRKNYPGISGVRTKNPFGRGGGHYF